MPKKFAFIGAGSLGFTRGLVKDILTFDAFKDAEICLMDIDETRLKYSKQGVARIIEAGKYPATVTATMDRAEALKGADGVLITILQGSVPVWRHDIEIPKKYGVDINVGDTRGPSGIFRFLRTAPVMLDICRDIEKLCPEAIVLNYTNPMALLCRYLQGETKVKISGLCHSVQGTAEMLAEWIGADISDVDYISAGINHQSFFTKYDWKGKDAIPLIRKAIVDSPEIANTEQVRNEMFLKLGYYPTESSGHDSEYVWWFRKRQDLIEKYCTHGTGWNPGEYAYILKEYERRQDTWEQEYLDWMNGDDIDLERGHEYAAYIFNAVFGDNTPFTFNGNVRNEGYVSNLPQGACVEIPVLAEKNSLTPQKVDDLPAQLQILVNHSALCEELAVEGCLQGNPEMIYHAVLFDPLTAAVLSMEEAKAMTLEMLDKNKDYLGYFKSLTF